MHQFKKCLIRLVLFLAYGVLGGWLFSIIEKRDETYATTANRLLEKLRKTMADKYNLTNSTEFHEFVEAASEATQTRSSIDWTFLNGCSFTFAALTTVGYGDITPTTSLGQGFTILYCLIGLPITMLALKTSGEVILLGLKTVAVNFEKKVLKRQNPQKTFFKCFILLICCQSLLICITAGVEMYLEGWTFLEGVYCWFITFTTIGFGDYVPFQEYRKKHENSQWKLFVSGLIFTVPYIVGLCLLSSLLSLLVESSEKIKVHFHQVTSCANCGNRRSESTIKDDDRKADDNNIKLQSYGFRSQDAESEIS